MEIKCPDVIVKHLEDSQSKYIITTTNHTEENLMVTKSLGSRAAQAGVQV